MHLFHYVHVLFLNWWFTVDLSHFCKFLINCKIKYKFTWSWPHTPKLILAVSTRKIHYVHLYSWIFINQITLFILTLQTLFVMLIGKHESSAALGGYFHCFSSFRLTLWLLRILSVLNNYFACSPDNTAYIFFPLSFMRKFNLNCPVTTKWCKLANKTNH